MSTVADVRSFEDLFRTEYASVAALCAWLTGDRSTGEDLAQDAFGAVYRRWAEVVRLDRPGAYVRRVAINMSSNERRRRGRQHRAYRLVLAREPASDGADPSTRDGHEELWKEIAALPLRQRAAIGLRYLDDLSTEEIAEALDCSPTTARVHLHRAHRRLADLLGCTTEHSEDQP